MKYMADRKESLGEFELIQRYFSKQSVSSVSLAQGDDCAILDIPSDQSLVFSIDTIVEGRHFPSSLKPEHVATRALGSALSDLAAMGAKPDHFTLALTLPAIDEVWIKSFSESLYEFASRFNISLVGGDTTKGPLAVTLQVHGLVPKNEALLRSGAEAGDGIYLSAPTGDAKAGLELLLKGWTEGSDDEENLVNRFLSPTPRVELAQQLRAKANACIDISDGLISDIEHMARASGLMASINLESIPLSLPLSRLFPEQALGFALQGGDDYELAFALPRSAGSLAEKFGLNQIGTFEAAEGESTIKLLERGKVVAHQQFEGFQHFGK
jgi:thiamine-monophosphate kinase